LRIIAFAAAAIVCGAAFAQNSAPEPSEQSALDAARSTYWSSQASAQAQTDNPQPESPASSGGTEQEKRPHSPVVLAFVPGLQLPFGSCDTSFCAAYIGAMTEDVDGFAAAGVFDMARDLHGFQASGVFNLSRAVQGFQAAGVFNMATSISGFQAAGLFNSADELSGTQIAGLFNVAKNVHGVQIGVVNVADHIDGVQIGLLNFARNGVGGLTAIYEPATNYVFTYWQTGTPYLYTLVGAGAPRNDWFARSDRAVFSLGFGSRMESHGAYLDIDVSAEEPVGPLVAEGLRSGFGSPTNPWLTPYPSARLSIGIPVAGRVHLVGGVKIDVDLLYSPGLPAELKSGRPYSDACFGVPFDAYATWFFGLRI